MTTLDDRNTDIVTTLPQSYHFGIGALGIKVIPPEEEGVDPILQITAANGYPLTNLHFRTPEACTLLIERLTSIHSHLTGKSLLVSLDSLNIGGK